MHAFWKGSKKTSTFEHQSWKQSMESWVVKPLIIFKIHSPVLGPVHVQRGKATFIYIQKTAWSMCFNILILHLIFSFILSVDDCKLVICISHVSNVCSAFFLRDCKLPKIWFIFTALLVLLMKSDVCTQSPLGSPSLYSLLLDSSTHPHHLLQH